MRAVRSLPVLFLLAAALSCQADVPAGLPGCQYGCASGGGGSGLGAHVVEVRNNYYSPATINVSVGDTVTWSWVGSNQHSVTFPTGGPFPDLGVHGAGTTISLLMTQSGTFTYYCTIHGANVMSGTVVVQ